MGGDSEGFEAPEAKKVMFTKTEQASKSEHNSYILLNQIY
jgi:hypothetical protein